jgi:hypothetical protein
MKQLNNLTKRNKMYKKLIENSYVQIYIYSIAKYIVNPDIDSAPECLTLKQIT